MEIAALIDALDHEGAALADAAGAAAMSDPVPGCPDWALRDLLGHVGEVHRWAAAIVAGGIASPSDIPQDAVGQKPDDGGLIDWYADGHRALVATLRAAPADLTCFTFLPAASDLAFWARRQAHETAIHRADADGAAGRKTMYDPALANDGIEEMLRGFATRPRTFDPGVVRLEPTDGPAWVVALDGEGAHPKLAESAALEAAVTVSGSAADVYRWLWNRPSTVSIAGDAEIAGRWQQVQVRWS